MGCCGSRAEDPNSITVQELEERIARLRQGKQGKKATEQLQKDEDLLRVKRLLLDADGRLTTTLAGLQNSNFRDTAAMRDTVRQLQEALTSTEDAAKIANMHDYHEGTVLARHKREAGILSDLAQALIAASGLTDDSPTPLIEGIREGLLSAQKPMPSVTADLKSSWTLRVERPYHEGHSGCWAYQGNRHLINDDMNAGAGTLSGAEGSIEATFPIDVFVKRIRLAPLGHGWGPGYLRKARIEAHQHGSWRRVGGGLNGNDQWVTVDTRAAKWRLRGSYIATSKFHFDIPDAAPSPAVEHMKYLNELAAVRIAQQDVLLLEREHQEAIREMAVAAALPFDAAMGLAALKQLRENQLGPVFDKYDKDKLESNAWTLHVERPYAEGQCGCWANQGNLRPTRGRFA